MNVSIRHVLFHPGVFTCLQGLDADYKFIQALLRMLDSHLMFYKLLLPE